MESPRPKYLDRYDLYVAGLLLMIAVLVAVVVIRAPRTVGTFQDDGLYLANAKSLADGHGYRHPELPGEPYQTKYPILYPLLLAGICRLVPDFPANLAVIQVVNTMLWAAGSWLAYLLARRVWGLPWWLPAAAVSLAFVNPGTLGLLQTAMSESLFLFLSMAALLVCTRDYARPARAARGVWAGLLAGLAYLTRMVGVAVMGAVLVDLALRRRWRALLSAGLISLAAFGGWQAWRVYATAANAQTPAASALAYELDYSIWMPHGLRPLGRVVLNNAAVVAADNLILMLPAFAIDIHRMLQRQGPDMPLLHAAFAIGLLISVTGLIATWRRRRLLLHLYIFFSLALILVWPFLPARFLLAFLPLLATNFLTGVFVILRWPSVFFAGMVHPERTAAPELAPGGVDNSGSVAAWSSEGPGYGVARGLTVLLSLALIWPCMRVIINQPGRAALERIVHDREEMIDQVRTVTPPDAVICSEMSGYLYLRTGRKFVPFLPWTDPLPYLYPDDRPLGGYGRVITPGELKNTIEHMEADLLPMLRATRASYVIPLNETKTTGGIAFAEFRRKHPGTFRLVTTLGKDSLYTFSEFVP
jgi:hypothetical protein